MRERTRLEATVKWVGYHLLELAAVASTLFAAIRLTWWFALLTGAVVALWAVQEWRAHRKRRQLRPGRTNRQLASVDSAHMDVVRVLPREGA